MEIERLEPDLSGDAVSADEARRFYEEELFAVGFRDVSFSYQKEGTNVSEVLSGMNMEVKKGDYVAFTGESGCGKSTTMNLLMGLYRPDRGM
ncbi:MAG: ATP-binding cassette domain-containing protein, partial [bacterium]